MHLWYASNATTFQQLGWRAGDDVWAHQQEWPNLNGHAGVGCYSWGEGRDVHVIQWAIAPEARNITVRPLSELVVITDVCIRLRLAGRQSSERCFATLTEDMPLARSIQHVSHGRDRRAVLRIRSYDFGLRASHPIAFGGQSLEPNITRVMLVVHDQRPERRISQIGCE